MLVNMNIAKIIRIKTKGLVYYYHNTIITTIITIIYSLNRVPVRSRTTGNVNMRSQICIKLKVCTTDDNNDDSDDDT